MQFVPGIRVLNSAGGIITPPADPPPLSADKLLSSHYMLAFDAYHSNRIQWLTDNKAKGVNHYWLFGDNYYTYYISDTQNFLNDCATVGGIYCSPGTQGGTPATETIQMYLDTWNHPALYRIGGKPVFHDYDHNPATYANVMSGMAAQNKPKSSYYLWTSIYLAQPTTHQVVVSRYADFPYIDGIINFAADKGTSSEQIISIINDINVSISTASAAVGKMGTVGLNGLYSSAQFTESGFHGLKSMCEAVIALPLSQRPKAISFTTADDYQEDSHMYAPFTPPNAQGLSYIPSREAGFTLGPPAQTGNKVGVIRKDGFQKFCEPYTNAFLSNSTTVNFSADRIFAFYALHPRVADTTSQIPSDLAPYAQFTQQYWDNTLYHDQYKPAWVASGQHPNFEKIEMAVHLTAPAQLKINDTLTAQVPAGSYAFSIDRGAFLGAPVFSIIRNGNVVMQKTGVPITNNSYPGGWSPIAYEP